MPINTLNDNDLKQEDWILTDPLPQLVLSPEQQARLETITQNLSHWQPGTAEELATCLRFASESKKKITLKPEIPQTAKVHLDLSKLNRVRGIFPKDMAVTVETGIEWQVLQEALAAEGLWIPLTYPSGTTVSEIFAHDLPALETGSLIYPGAYPRDYVLGVEMAGTDGYLSHYGGLVVKNATGYDLNKLYTGSRNQFGVLTAVTLKVVSKPKAVISFEAAFDFKNFGFINELMASSLPILALEIVSAQTPHQQDVLFIQLASHYEELISEAHAGLVKLAEKYAIKLSTSQVECWLEIVPEKKAQLIVEMAYTFNQQQQSLEDWLEVLRLELQQALPTAIRIQPQAQLIHLGWDKTHSIDQELKTALETLNQKLKGNNPWGVPEGFLSCWTCPTELQDSLGLNQGEFLSRKLLQQFDPNRCLSNAIIDSDVKLNV